MKVHYDEEADALYFELEESKPDGCVEVSDGIQIDTTPDNRIVGIEILNASQRIDLKSLQTYSFENVAEVARLSGRDL